MMENEIMNYEEVMEPEVEIYEVEPEESKMSVGLAMLIGAGLTAASIAAVKLGKTVWTKIKAKKDSKQTEEDDAKDLADEKE
jgi:hypothetical protein